MNEVEKIYSNAGVENEFTSCELDHCAIDKLYSCGNCKHFCKKNYPPFTAEKQLELIKWLAVKGDFDSSIDIAKNTYDYWTMYFKGARWTAEGFEESLAGLINTLWQDLTEEERKQIKEILE